MAQTNPIERLAAARPSIDGRCIERMRARDEAAWTDFLRDYDGVFARSVRCAIHRLYGSAALDDDERTLIDEAKTYFYRAFMANFDAYRSEGQFRSYLFRTVTNCLRERTRRRRREVQLGSDSQWGPTVPPEMPAIDDDRMAALRRCIGRLAHSLRSVLMLLYFSEQPMSMTQLATVLGTSASAVQKRHWRGMIALRECMESSQEVNGDVV